MATPREAQPGPRERKGAKEEAGPAVPSETRLSCVSPLRRRLGYRPRRKWLREGTGSWAQ